MENEEIHQILAELFKRFSTKRKYFIQKYFSKNRHSIEDVEQDFYVKMYESLLKDYEMIEKIQDERYLHRALQNFIIDQLRKNKNDKTTYLEDELIDNLIFNFIMHEDSNSYIQINLSEIINDLNFSEFEQQLLIDHYVFNLKFVVLNELYKHSNLQQKANRLITKIKDAILRIKEKNIDYEIIIINDLI
jgi:DNA-directed RNA polymerase specialized sigma24 family protein